VRAAILFAPEDLRVSEVADPVPGPGETLVRIDAATTCGTDVKMWRRGHPILPAYPARFGHEMAGTREDTGERVLVGDSVPCGNCRACAAGRPQICREPRWVLGGFAELMAAP
jgi:L-iditol 2-dehydrogenase